jgi:hypothetical protein
MRCPIACAYQAQLVREQGQPKKIGDQVKMLVGSRMGACAKIDVPKPGDTQQYDKVRSAEFHHRASPVEPNNGTSVRCHLGKFAQAALLGSFAA